MNILKKINNLFKHEPHNIFHTTTYEYHKYRNGPQVEGDLFGIYTRNGYFRENFHYTVFGEYIQTWPILSELLFKAVYYILSWPLYIIVKLPWLIFKGLFIPQTWLK